MSGDVIHLTRKCRACATPRALADFRTTHGRTVSRCVACRASGRREGRGRERAPARTEPVAATRAEVRRIGAWSSLSNLPMTRGECVEGPRPCPLVGCAHNLYLDVHPSTGAIKFNFPDRAPEDMPPGESCVLDIVDAEEDVPLARAGALMNISFERVRQIEGKFLRRVRRQAKLDGAAGRDTVFTRLTEYLGEGPLGDAGRRSGRGVPEADDLEGSRAKEDGRARERLCHPWTEAADRAMGRRVVDAELGEPRPRLPWEGAAPTARPSEVRELAVVHGAEDGDVEPGSEVRIKAAARREEAS